MRGHRPQGGWKSKLREEGPVLQEALSWELREMSSDGIQLELRGWLAVASNQGSRLQLNYSPEGLSVVWVSYSKLAAPLAGSGGASEQQGSIGVCVCVCVSAGGVT